MQITLVVSLHKYLERNRHYGTHIIPIGKLNMSKMKKLLEKFPSIIYQHRTEIVKWKEERQCYLHYICKNPSDIYGVKSARRRRPNCNNLLEDYKHISRKINKLNLEIIFCDTSLLLFIFSPPPILILHVALTFLHDFSNSLSYLFT
jgi:hypothetical protein